MRRTSDKQILADQITAAMEKERLTKKAMADRNTVKASWELDIGPARERDPSQHS